MDREDKNRDPSWLAGFKEDNRLLLDLFRGPFGLAYLAIAIATLLFQLRLRLSTCEGFGECTSSLIKAIVWSMVWPVYWWGYLTDFTVFKLWSNPRGN